MIDLSSEVYAQRISSGFGQRTAPTAGASSNHLGVDIILKDYSVPVVADGRVTENAYNNVRGYYVTVQHRDGTSTRYQHLANASTIPTGTDVSEGTIIGTMGSSGVSTGDHLHFEVFDGAGTYLDPEEYLKMGGTFDPSGNYEGLPGVASDALDAAGDFVSDKAFDVLGVVIKFIAYVAIAVAGAAFFFKAFDVKIGIGGITSNG